MRENNRRSGQRPMLSQDFLWVARRTRLSDAHAELCLEQGYRETTVTDIVARAGTSRNTFFETFSSRRASFTWLVERAGG
jgi:AcrR family transcriptional regulator